MGTIVVTGSAGGIGAATAEKLEAAGHRVIGVDVRDAEVVADLATVGGRAAMVDAVTAASGGVIDGLVAGAGVQGTPGELTVSVNYFGAVATLDGLRPLLAEGGAAVAISSNSATMPAALPADVIAACLAGDEAEARRLAEPDAGGLSSYPASKLALARWVRRQAITADWIGAGRRLNAIAPGFCATPMTTDIADFVMSLGDVYPIPAGRAGTAEEVAALLVFLLGPDAGFFCGSFITMDGGTEAALRADDWPAALS